MWECEAKCSTAVMKLNVKRNMKLPVSFWLFSTPYLWTGLFLAPFTLWRPVEMISPSLYEHLIVKTLVEQPFCLPLIWRKLLVFCSLTAVLLRSSGTWLRLRSATDTVEPQRCVKKWSAVSVWFVLAAPGVTAWSTEQEHCFTSSSASIILTTGEPVEMMRGNCGDYSGRFAAVIYRRLLPETMLLETKALFKAILLREV